MNAVNKFAISLVCFASSVGYLIGSFFGSPANGAVAGLAFSSAIILFLSGSAILTDEELKRATNSEREAALHRLRS